MPCALAAASASWTAAWRMRTGSCAPAPNSAAPHYLANQATWHAAGIAVSANAQALYAAAARRELHAFALVRASGALDASEARRILEGASTGARLDDARERFSRVVFVAN